MKELSIPKIIHQIWIGHKDKPIELLNTWKEKHNDDKWEYILWDEEKIKEKFPNGLINQQQFDAIHELAGKADILRYEILYTYGGFYCDADSVCLQKLDDFLLEDDFFICFENEEKNKLYANGFIGCQKNSKIIKMFIDYISKNLNKENINLKQAWQLTGPLIVTHIINNFLKTSEYPEKIKIYPSYLFMDMKKILFNSNNDSNEEPKKYKKYAEHLWYSTQQFYKINK
jgi:mannosyltransferase OCH1-like enzyme